MTVDATKADTTDTVPAFQNHPHQDVSPFTIQPFAIAWKVYQPAGWEPLPLPACAKHDPPPGTTGSAGTPLTVEQLERWATTNPGGNIGIRMPATVLGIDVDQYGDKNGAGALAAFQLEHNLPDLPPAPYSSSRGPGLSGIRFYRVPAGWEPTGTGPCASVEYIRHGHRYAVAAPSAHPEGGTYCWYTADGQTTSIPHVDSLPELPAEWIAAFGTRRSSGPTKPAATPAQVSTWLSQARDDSTSNCPYGATAFHAIRSDVAATPAGGRHDAMFKGVQRAYELIEAGCLTHAAMDTLRTEFTQVKPEARPTEFDEFIQHAIANTSAKTGCSKHGRAVAPAPRVTTSPNAAPAPADTAPAKDEPHRGQARLAYRLADTHADTLRHARGIGWLCWDGTRWIEDDTGAATRAVLDTLRAGLLEAFDEGDKELAADVRKCESAAGIAGILNIAAALKPLAVTVADLDANPYLLNVANGTFDLHTFELREHRPSDLITKVTRAAYRPGEHGARFDQFLNRVLPDPEVRAFLQRYAGVALCGRVLEHVLAILTGTGRNGKGVFYGALGHALGDYATTAEPDLFMHRDGAHPTGEMDLRGVRWAVVSESDHGRKLAEATVKRLTGGDRIKARRMRQDFVEFDPSHTAALVTNHLPQVRGDDPAIWARLRVVPFEVVIPKAEQDVHLPEALQLEADAILTWALEGWRSYQAIGLAEPDAVTKATEEYQSDMDAVGQFIDECCLLSPHDYARFADLYAEWAKWAASNGAATGTKKAFGAALDGRGLVASKGTGNASIRRGITLQGGDL